MRKSIETGAFLTAVFCLAAVAGFFVGGEALALPPNEVETFFYSDATYSEQVGWRILMCDGTRYQEGLVTDYRQYYSTPCW